MGRNQVEIKMRRDRIMVVEEMMTIKNTQEKITTVEEAILNLEQRILVLVQVEAQTPVCLKKWRLIQIAKVISYQLQ